MYVWMDMDGFRYFQSMPENENMQNVICFYIAFSFDIYMMRCGMVRFGLVWYDDVDDDDDDENAMFRIYTYCSVHCCMYVYKNAVMCHFHGNHVPNSILYFHYVNRLIRFIGDHCQSPSPLIDSKLRLWGANYQFSLIFVIFFFSEFIQAKRNTIYSLIFFFVCTMDLPSYRGFVECSQQLLFSYFHWKHFLTIKSRNNFFCAVFIWICELLLFFSHHHQNRG